MPIGIIVNASVIIIGGIAGYLLSSRLDNKTKEVLFMLFGLASIGMGIRTVCTMENMAPCILSLIVGTCIGLAIHLQKVFTAGGKVMQSVIGHFVHSKPGGMTDTEFSENLLTVTVIFCFSSTGIYGSIVSGMGDHSMLLAKSVLDLFTAMVFGCSLGLVVSIIAVPQFVIFMLLFALAKVIFPLTTESMILDFKAVGGMLLVANGFRLLKLKEFPVADMVPAMILIMPLSWLWTAFILPLL